MPYPVAFWQDVDPSETREWVEALRNVIQTDGLERAESLVQAMLDTMRHEGSQGALDAETPYVNTLLPEATPDAPEEGAVAQRASALVRWNAIAMVVRACRHAEELGGHLSTYASAALFYDVALNYFIRGRNDEHLEDLVYVQGHASPGIYARAFLEGQLTEEQLANFRQEVGGGGLSSYPHPWLMDNFWQFPTVSMGLGPMMAIYQARFLRYLDQRGLCDLGDRRVWAFLGDAEMDEPESKGCIDLPVREGLDHLVFVINSNLQGLDGPVRGNGKSVQELEAFFRGAGWRVIKVLWNDAWDGLLEADHEGVLRHYLMHTVDGTWQHIAAGGPTALREHFFGQDPRLAAMVEGWSDARMATLGLGGHDLKKVYGGFKAATERCGRPTLLMLQTIKGYGLGAQGSAVNVAHNKKKMSGDELWATAQFYGVPITEEQAREAALVHPGNEDPAVRFLQARREAMGGPFPQRFDDAPTLPVPTLSTFQPLLDGSGDREISTTMAYVRFLTILLKDKGMGKHVVPIVPDESRTFGMEGLFRQVGLYAADGQKYVPVDRQQLMFYREAHDGQMFQAGISEAGAMSCWMAAATSYSSNRVPMVPFFAYYSMFGFQRIGDLAWAAGDMRARGFMIGGTAGRTTLAGEGLQHQDGHSHLWASMIPNCVAYDPCYSYELAVILHHGLERMLVDQDDVFFYVTTMNENYTHPPMPEDPDVVQGIIKGLYALPPSSEAADPGAPRAQLLGSGAILNEVVQAAEHLRTSFGVEADVWSVTSFTELRREALLLEREATLNPDAPVPTPHITQCLEGRPGPVVAASDYVRLHADQVRAYVPQASYVTLGTDGFGRSDTRAQLRDHFEVDARHIAYVTVVTLVEEGSLPPEAVARARELFNIDTTRPHPLTR